MHTPEMSIELPSQEARRAPEEGSQNGWKKPTRFSAQRKAEVVLRLLRGEALDLLSRELGIPAARIATWRERVPRRGPGGDEKPPARQP